MNNLTPELIAAAKAAKSADEIAALAKEAGFEFTEEEAKTCFEQLHANAEVSDDELETVSGGGICQDVIEYFRWRSGRNDSACPYCGDKSKTSAAPEKPTLDGGITLLPGDPNDKGTIVFL